MQSGEQTMIPIKLQLRNFMCYRDPTPLDFSGMHLACLAGDNGHGKSALLDAITWALWGKARARSDDELVMIGEKEMEVEFEFQLGGAQYRVIRKRELARRSRGALELQVKGDGDFRSFTASTQRETQARIDDVLRMDYDTFINSALLLQGRADEFTVKPPAQRKQILGDILGLSIYDQYEQRAKELAKEKEQEGREVQARIQDIDRELEHRPEYESELRQAHLELSQLSEQAQASETTLQQLRGQLKTLETQRTQASEVEQRIHSSESQLEELDQRIAAQERRLAAYQSILARQVEIEHGHGLLVQTRQQEDELNRKLSQLLELRDRKGEAEKAIAEAQKTIEMQAQAARDAVQRLEQQVQQATELEAELAKVAAEVAELSALQTKAEEARHGIAELATASASVEALNEQLKLQMGALKEKIALLQQPTAACPLCGQDLSEAHREDLLQQFQDEGQTQGDEYRRNIARLEENARQRSDRQSELREMELELKRLPALQGRETHLSTSLDEAREAAQELGGQKESLARLQVQLERRQFAEAEQEKLAAVAAQIKALAYDGAAHEQLRQALTELAHFEPEKVELDKAEQALGEARENQQQLQRTRQQLQRALETDRARWSTLSAALQAFDDLKRDLEARQLEADELRRREGHARTVVGAVQQKLDHCTYLAGERRQRVEQGQAAAEERSLYEELRTAFGKRGVQALIIENVIPELEDEANNLLARMTDGRMTVQFETQRDTKAGHAVETLDIRISDEYGSRNYEMYSGGEAFRIDFAIRIALSKLLARRAGAQLQTLIIDEGFGTQDADGRQKLVQAINSIRDDFARIIVITHIEELKDAFPVRIDVYKTPRGSEISIS
jgi:exonuclease SbcC